MTTQRCIELFSDQELQAFIRCECRRYSPLAEAREDYFAAAWVAISSHEVDDCDMTTLERVAHNGIVKAYRAELRQRKLLRDLMESYEAEGQDPRLTAPRGRTKGAGILLEPRSSGKWD